MTGLYSDQVPSGSVTWGPECLGLKFHADVDGQITAIRYWANPTSNSNNIPVGLYNSVGVLLSQGIHLQDPVDAGNWVTVPLTVAVLISANTDYVAAYNPVQYRMPYAAEGFAAPRDNGSLHAAAGACLHNINNNLPTLSFPSSSVGNDDYFIDVEFVPGTGDGSGAAGAPVADAGPNQTLIEPFTEVQLDGSATPSSAPVALQTWRQISGPSVELSDYHQLNPTFLAPGVLNDQALVLGLTVVDSDGHASVESTVTISVISATEFVCQGGQWKAIKTLHSW